MSFSIRLKRLREEKNIRQEDLATILNISRQAISNYEQGTRIPKDEKILILIADYFNVTIDYLLGRDLYKTPYLNCLNDKKETYRHTKAVLLEMLQNEAAELSEDLIESLLNLIQAMKMNR